MKVVAGAGSSATGDGRDSRERSAREAGIAAATPSQEFDAGRAGDRRGLRCAT